VTTPNIVRQKSKGRKVLKGCPKESKKSGGQRPVSQRRGGLYKRGNCWEKGKGDYPGQKEEAVAGGEHTHIHKLCESREASTNNYPEKRPQGGVNFVNFRTPVSSQVESPMNYRREVKGRKCEG